MAMCLHSQHLHCKIVSCGPSSTSAARMPEVRSTFKPRILYAAVVVINDATEFAARCVWLAQCSCPRFRGVEGRIGTSMTSSRPSSVSFWYFGYFVHFGCLGTEIALHKH